MTKFEMGAEAEGCLTLLVLCAVPLVTRPHVNVTRATWRMSCSRWRGDEAGDGRSTERAVSHAEDMHSFAGDTSVVLLYTGRLLLSSRKH